MRNITVSVDDETYKRARIRAAERSSSVSALVRQFLQDLAADDQFAARAHDERAVRESIGEFDASERLERDAVHRRGG
jgi:plasmid stability protein